jgi:DNA-binding LytR/AlgR family response regulator
MVALDLEGIVLDVAAGQAQVAITASVVEARRALAATVFDAALLDVDVVDGKTFELASMLDERGMPFAFVSGSRRDEIPPPLRHIPFVPKPYDPAAVEQTLLARLARRG